MGENKAADKDMMPYHKPVLVYYGSLQSLTRTNQGGPAFDGGTNPRHKGPVVTGGAFNIDPDFYDDSGSGSAKSDDIFE